MKTLSFKQSLIGLLTFFFLIAVQYADGQEYYFKYSSYTCDTDTRFTTINGEPGKIVTNECVFMVLSRAPRVDIDTEGGQFLENRVPNYLEWNKGITEVIIESSGFESIYKNITADDRLTLNDFQVATFRARDENTQCFLNDCPSPNLGLTVGPTITFELYPIVTLEPLAAGVSRTLCGDEGLSLQATGNWDPSKYRWWFAESSTPSVWRSIPGVTGQKNPSIKITDFGSNASLAFDKQINIGVSIGDSDCSQCTPTNMIADRSMVSPTGVVTTLNDIIVNVKYQAPIPDMETPPTPIAPTCRDDEGAFEIVHEENSANTTFNYTITQYVFSRDGDCGSNVLANGNRRVLSDLRSTADNVFTPSYDDATSFCTGFIGNFSFEIKSSSVNDRTIVIDSGGIRDFLENSIPIRDDDDNLITNTIQFFEGVYELKVEASGDNSCTRTYIFEIPPSDYEDLELLSTPSSNAPSCQGEDDGSFEITLEKGLDRADGNFEWSLSANGNTISDLTSDRTFTTSNLLSFGTDYTLSVEDRCATHSFGTVTLASEGPELSPVISKADPSCMDDMGGNGSITVNAPSGVADKDYTYALFIPNGGISTPDQQVGDAFNIGTTERLYTFPDTLSAREYYVQATAPGCTIDSSNSVTLNAPASFAINSIARGTITPVVCATGGNDGAVVLTGISKAAEDDISLQYTISGGGLSSPRTGTINRSDLSSGAYTISGLPSGNGYSISLIDLCKGNEPVALADPTPFNITQPQAIDLEDIPDIDIACFETPSSININILEGTAPFVVNVFKKNPTSDLFDLPAFFTDNDVERSDLPLPLAGLSVGDYRVEVTSGSPCTADDDFDEFTISAGNATAALSATITKRVNTKNGLNLDCNADNTGQLTVVVSGGVRDGSDEYDVVLTDNNNIPFTDDATAGNSTPTISSGTFNSSAGTVTYTISDLTSGITYRVRITDSNSTGSCVKTFTTDNLGNDLSLSQPDVLNLRAVTVDQLAGEVEEPTGSENFFLQCNGDNNITYTAQLRGGSQPYRVRLYRKDTTSATSNYSIEESEWDRQGINASSVAFPNLGMGDYRVILSDTNSCTQSTRFFTINEREALGSSADTLEYAHGFNVRCIGESNGSITLFATGGLKPYTFDLFRDGSLLSSLAQEGNTSQRTFSGLAALNGATPYEYTWRVV
ncbi:MAG: hypothetical protein AAFQ94_19290, partial [Bacteroidota bacterium]